MKKATLSRWFDAAKTNRVSMRVVGDAARDSRDWSSAEAAYSAHLEEVPDDFDIWVQLGHSLKEQNKLDAAEDAYRRAITLRPEDADVHLQLGHLLKRVGRVVEASESYMYSLKNSPSKDAYSELRALNESGLDLSVDESLFATQAATDVVFIEIDDMLGYLEAHKTLSGIQRVQVGVIQHVISHREQPGNVTYLFVLNPLDAKCLWALDTSTLAEIVEYVTGPQVSHDRLKQMIARARSQATAVNPQAGQAYLILGAFWGYGGVAARYFHLKKAGVVIGAYVYDLIPITHIEYCDEGLPHEFALSFGDGMSVFDFVLTISEFTAREVGRYRERFGLPPMPIKAVPLAHASAIAPRKRPVWGPQVAHLRDRPFVLMVSTIEARKNHMYLVAAWKQFLDEGLDPPDLVFVGRVGWRVKSLMEMLETTRYFDERIHIVHDLSDEDLNTLYSACLFTAFPSFVEGWGLPVGESLAHGKPCVASSTSSVPEVGGDLVDYLDPQNLREGIEVLRRMIFDEPYRQKRTEEIVSKFKLRSWQDVGADLLHQVAELRATPARQEEPEVLFARGRVFRPGSLALGRKLPADYALQPLRLMLTDSWYGVELLGCWLRGKSASLSFRTGLAAGSAISVYLQLYGAPWAAAEHKITISIGWPGKRPKYEPNQLDVVSKEILNGHFNLHLVGQVGPNGVVYVNFSISGQILPEAGEPNGRSFVVGLGGLGYAEHNDPLGRLNIQDDLNYHGLEKLEQWRPVANAESRKDS